ncbi:MAG: hypothetical protein J0J01_25150 [Reyranella sp.]|uniref:hypothetical protein n=1 Tax=Reyranella sp. TaxID=1929291 RepID=UPI001AD352ED|nr:hypothetical protein [Reyranella sp.]MBN9090212.1 hypothetical protein [Reyranella sp.]
MGHRWSALIAGFVGLLAVQPAARAQCTLPYTIANGQPADASKVMANFNALIACISPGGSANSVQYNAGSGALGGVGPLTNGQIVIGSTGNAPQAQTLTAGSGISISNGPGSITVGATSLTGAKGLYRQVMSATPTTSNTGLATWLNQGSAIATDSAIGLAITAPSAGASINIAGRFKAAPVTPYTITALVAATRSATGNNGVGIGWYDGTSKLHTINFALPAGTPGFQIVRFNTPTSFSGVDFTSSNNAFAQPMWLQIADDGTNVSFAFSQDGANFVVLFSTTKAAGFLGASGYKNVIFYIDPEGGQTIGTLMSWTQN